MRTADHRGVENAYVTNVSGQQATASARRWCAEISHHRPIAQAARGLLSAFKVPSVWLLLDSDDEVPRGGTGKVDIRRLREMLIGANQP